MKQVQFKDIEIGEKFLDNLGINVWFYKASDQPDAPKGKFLKSASYTNTVFPEVV